MMRLFIAVLRSNPANYADQSMQVWVENRVEQPLVQQFFQMVTRLTTYSIAPAQMSAGAWLYQFQRGLKGVKYLHNGWQSLVNGLIEKATAAGVHFETGARVQEVVIENGHVQGIRHQRWGLCGCCQHLVQPPYISRLLNDKI